MTRHGQEGAPAGAAPVRQVKALIDARGLACPLPLVKARQAMMLIDAGERICVLATDPAAPRDFGEYCEVSGHILVEQREEAGVYVFVLEKVTARRR